MGRKHLAGPLIQAEGSTLDLEGLGSVGAAQVVGSQGRSGLNVWVPVADEASVLAGLLRRGYCVRPGARYRIRSATGIRITTARLSEAQAPEV